MTTWLRRPGHKSASRICKHPVTELPTCDSSQASGCRYKRLYGRPRSRCEDGLTREPDLDFRAASRLRVAVIPIPKSTVEPEVRAELETPHCQADGTRPDEAGARRRRCCRDALSRRRVPGQPRANKTGRNSGEVGIVAEARRNWPSRIPAQPDERPGTGRLRIQVAYAMAGGVFSADGDEDREHADR